MIVGFRKGEVGLLVHRECWSDIKHDHFSHFGRVIDADSMGNPGAPVVSAEVEVVKSMMLHDTHAVLCHSSLAVTRVTLFLELKFRGKPVSSKVDGHYGECVCQLLCYSVPNEVILWEPDSYSAGALFLVALLIWSNVPMKQE